MTARQDPHRVLGVPEGASPAEITAAYRRLVRALHPDTATPDPERLAAVLAAYRELRGDDTRTPPPPSTGVTIPVRVRREPRRSPDLRAGPVRHDPPG